jgi:bifunctional non-homologous end joining protein LigD
LGRAADLRVPRHSATVKARGDRAPAILVPEPMLLREDKPSPLGKEGWHFEIKWDGYRMLAGIAAGRVHLRSRGDMDYTKRFPEVVADLASLGEGPHVLDGEMVVLHPDGRADFEALHDRARRNPRQGERPAVFMVFDALMIGGQGLIDEPIERRKAALHQLLGDRLVSVRYVEHFPAGVSRSLYQQAVNLNIEGLVAKRSGSLYVPGERSPDWQKVKVPGAIPAERFKR